MAMFVSRTRSSISASLITIRPGGSPRRGAGWALSPETTKVATGACVGMGARRPSGTGVAAGLQATINSARIARVIVRRFTAFSPLRPRIDASERKWLVFLLFQGNGKRRGRLDKGLTKG